ncbi:hypothetical protein WJX72_006245 [[Myrmecia] bisecta]|uniref:EamA domain-containing protein n=1 Tax=[Myrmecia] bisecta TaxID=41462 RepID=A0AAW1PSY5_9CHLO
MVAIVTVASVTGLLVFGTTTSLFAKIVYELQGEGLDGEKFFRKPWAMTTVMFLGMTFCLPLAYLQEYRNKKKLKELAGDSAGAPLLPDGRQENGYQHTSELKQVMMLSIPTVFDLIATVLMNIGLLSVTASVYQMMRGAEMLFAALFSVTFLHRHLNKNHFMGIGCCVMGICLVGMSSMLAGEGSSTHDVPPTAILMGMLLIIASQCVQAAQITFEEFFLTDMDIAPLKIVGYEGLFGSIAMICVMLPLVHFLPGEDGEGIHEDSLDTLHMIGHSRSIQIVLAVDMLALLSYNFAGMCVTGQLGAVFRTVLETMRTLFVWLVDLLLFYTIHKLGESWTEYSWIQAAGFVVLVCGTLIYGRGDEKAIEEIIEEAQEGHGPQSPAAGAFAPVPASSAAAAVPGGGRAPSRPVSMRGTPSSFKSTRNLTSFGSYHQSYTYSRSLQHTIAAAESPHV